MTSYVAPHDPVDRDKVLGLVESMRLGDPVPPIVVNGEVAITGSHRIAAQAIAWELWDSQAPGWEGCGEPTLDTIEVDNDLLADAMDQLTQSRDYNELCELLHGLAEDSDLRAALADQF